MYSVMEDNSVALRSKKFKKLTKAICGLVSYSFKDFSLSRRIDKYWYMYNSSAYLGLNNFEEKFLIKNAFKKIKLQVCCTCLLDCKILPKIIANYI